MANVKPLAKPLTAKEAFNDIEAYKAQLRQRIEAEVSGFSVDPAARAERIHDAFSSFEIFVGTYFPHYVRSPHKSALHKYLFARLPAIISSPKSETDAIAAPRGEAKSTLVSQLFVLWCLVTDAKHYIVIIMDSMDQAQPMLEAIKAELAFNPRLLCDFPAACGQGPRLAGDDHRHRQRRQGTGGRFGQETARSAAWAVPTGSVRARRHRER